MIATAGCSQVTTPRPEEVVETTTPAPEVTEAKTGDVLPTEPATLPESQSAVPMDDGTYIVVTATEPLPEPVKAQIHAEVAGKVLTHEAQASDPMALDRAFSAARGAASSASSQTGKKVVVIFPVVGSCTFDEDPYDGWSYTSVTSNDRAVYDCQLATSVDEAQQRVADLISRQPDPSQYEVVVGN